MVYLLVNLLICFLLVSLVIVHLLVNLLIFFLLVSHLFFSLCEPFYCLSPSEPLNNVSAESKEQTPTTSTADESQQSGANANEEDPQV